MSRDWMRLDNAALIYPAAKKRKWTALFRLSATLDAPVDPEALSSALSRTLARIPTFACVLRRGAFWYFLEKSGDFPGIEPDVRNPCVTMHPKNNGGFSFRVRYYDSRIAVEIFHVLTDGYGGLTFLCTLVAEYLRIVRGADIPAGGCVLSCDDKPRKSEMEDGFVKHATRNKSSLREPSAFRLTGEPDRHKIVNVITGMIPADDIIKRAKAMGVSVTEYLTAVLICSIAELQKRRVPDVRRRRPVKINVPVNLRAFFETDTLRNFASYVNPGIEPRRGEYDFEEVVRHVHHFMGMEVTEKKLGAKFSSNVRIQKNRAIAMAPLFLKNIVMKQVFNKVGDKKTCTCFSNLGRLSLPPEMESHIERIEFMLGPLSINPIAVAAISYRGTLNITFTRTIKGAELEREFFTRLVKSGVHVKIESNQRW